MKHWSLTNLDIIATNAALGKEPVAPRVIAPVFRDRTTGTILLPPFSLIGDEVFNAHESNDAEYEEFVKREELTPLPKPVPAKTNHDLWVDENGDAHYEPKHVVKRKFESIFIMSMALAQQHFQSGDHAIAAKHAFRAGAVKPTNLEPLKLRAACELRQQQNQCFEFTCEIASRYMTQSDFRKLVTDFAGEYAVRAPLVAASFHGAASMKNMANRRSLYTTANAA